MSSPPNSHQLQVSLRRRFLSLPTLLFFAVAIAFIFFLETRFDLDWERTREKVLGMDVGLYLLALVLYYASFVFRGLRWRTLASNASSHESSRARLPSALGFSQLIVIGWFVNGVAWGRLGDAYRAYALSEDSGEAFPWSLGTVLAERAVDMATVLVMVVVGVALFSAARDSGETGYLLLAALLMALSLGALLVAMKGYGARAARFLPGRFREAYGRFQEGTLGSLKNLPLVFGFGLAAWLLEVARMYFVVQALDLSIGIPLVLIVALGHAILSTVPTPGGVGVVEPGITGLLVLGMASEDAVSVALVDRSITYVSIIIFGGLVFLLRQATRRWRRGRRSNVPSPAAGGEHLADAQS